MPIRQRKDADGRPIPKLWEIATNLPRERGRPRRRKSSTFRGTKREAEAEDRRLQRLADEGKLVAHKLTVGDLFDRYLEEHVRLYRAPNTYAQYRIALSVRAGELRRVPAAKLALHHLTAHRASLIGAPQRRGGRESQATLSAVSVARYLAPVKSALAWAEGVELLARNPARFWQIGTEESPERPAFDRDQARRFLDALNGSPWRPHLLVLFSTNLRLSELRGLRWEDVNLDEGTYRVAQQWQRANRWTEAPDGTVRWPASDVRREQPKSRSGRRGGGLSDEVAQHLRDWRQQQDDRRCFLGRRWREPDGGALVFADPETGGPFNPASLRDHYYRLLRGHGLPRIHLHDLRHSWLNLQLEAGTPMDEASKLMGHASEAVTRKIYQHLTKALGRRAAERFRRYLDGADAEGEGAADGG